MNSPFLPRALKKAINLLQEDPARPWTLDELAAACGTARRTLQTHFRRFLGQTPLEFLRLTRLGMARRQLLKADPQASVTQIAGKCGFTHLGRFAGWYGKQYGESPSKTLQRSQAVAAAAPSPLPLLSAGLERPAIAVLPFNLIGPEAMRAAGLSDEIAAALCRCRWFSVTSPAHARYHLRGKARADGRGQLRVTVALLDATTERDLFADCWEGGADDIFGFEDRVSRCVTRALQAPVRDAEINRAWHRDPARLTAWELTMRALRGILSVEPTAAGTTLEWLERAMELAPRDPLPVSLAAWCHSVRASHHQTRQPDRERQAARQFADRACLLNNGDPIAEAMLAAAYTLAHDLDTASVHADRALDFDPGSAWAWGRSAWIHAYRGHSSEAIERFQIALDLTPADPLRYQWSLGISSAHFETGRYAEAARWSRRALAEQPKAVTIHRLLAPACALAGAKEEARRSFEELMRQFPELTIDQVSSALPLTRSHLSRRGEGLASVGMRSY
jgi:AraC-like DNA-binding protein